MIIQLKTNIKTLKLTPNIAYWKYDIRMYLVFAGQDGNEHLKEITKQTRDDYLEQERKAWAVEIYKYLLKEKRNIFPKNGAVFYDRAAVLFTANEKMKISEKEETLKLPTSAITNCPIDAEEVRVVIKPVSDAYQVSSNDLQKVVNVRNIERDKALLEVLNLATSQEGYLNTERFVTYGTANHYLYDPSEYKVEESELPPLADGKYMGIGASKSVKILEGDNTNGKGSAFVVTDGYITVMKGAFHYDNQNLLEKISQLSAFIDRRTQKSTFTVAAASDPYNRSLILQMIRGETRLYVTTTYTDDKQKKRTFQIGGLGSSATEIKSAAVILRSIFRYPGMATVTDRYKPDSFYPMELLTVAPSQRVTQQQQTLEEKAAMIKASAVNPWRRFELTKNMAKALNIEPGNQLLAKAGITVDAEFFQSKWDLNDVKFLEPISLDKWAVCTMLGPREAHTLKTKEYLHLIQERGRYRGMNIGTPEVSALQQVTEANIRGWFERQKKAGKRFLMFICSGIMKMRNDIKVHDYLKLLEVEFQIVTQQILSNKVSDVVEKRQTQTLDNVLAKINLKLGGVNHNVVPAVPLAPGFNWLADKDSLIVGFSISNPPPVSKGEIDKDSNHKMPSVVGWSANCSQNHQSFIGGYLYVDARQGDMMGPKLGDVIVDIVGKFRKAKSLDPRHILFYFSGISEGQWALIADTYMEAIRNGLTKAALKTKPSLTAVASSSDHNERIYRLPIPQGRSVAEMNIPPGTVVDRKIVSPAMNEFFLNSHSAFQGTAKTPKYSLVYDDSMIPMDSLEIITHCLCYLHAIVPAPTADPAPLIVAARNAQRGHDIYIAKS
ncbi:piwi domain protein [Oesophagostomum dentatum]|uniref:Piwi domain protein n=1 Tax=Oesophagostomum dentatum TaxID=61180 RepID=A0A0B1TVD2_OESDE|nr:piwi domain protein [Oesophagostomum dentatum]